MSTRPPEPPGLRRRSASGTRKLVLLCSLGIAVGLGGMIATAQEEDSPAAVTDASGQRTYEVAGFERISAVGADQVVVSVGPRFAVHGAGNADTLDRYQVTADGGALKIEPKHGAWWGWPWPERGHVTFKVTLPQLSAASFVGSGAMTIDKVSGRQFAANVAGSGKMEIGELAVDDARFSVAGSGDAELTVNDDAQVSTIGSGDVTIGGSAHCTVSTIGSGNVTCPDRS